MCANLVFGGGAFIRRRRFFYGGGNAQNAAIIQSPENDILRFRVMWVTFSERSLRRSIHGFYL